MTGKNDSEGLIPVETHQNAILSPVSPMHTAEGTNTYSSPPSQIANEPPVPPYERNRPEEAPIPVDPTPVSEKAYPGQPFPDQQTGFATQQPVHHPADVKAYPGQPVSNQFQPKPYYTPQLQPTNYPNALPLHALQSAPAPVDCLACRQREVTRVESVSGSTTHALAAVLCFCCCLGCIPYLVSSFKDVNHFCGKCGAKLACWHNSGKIEVLQHAQTQAQAQTATPASAK
ncbi:hypothetical protein N7456_003990 [Penicillium angulare]|uniref:LITAF domain-containing protein n=1 Tax=Penicillium angulare TaxID=116970 RepID=A0A9W9FWI6_9EURO|nr:hypothetical protein N7456_003990 [Penicillium angulare]